MFHIAAAKAKRLDENVLEIYDILRARKVDPHVKDNNGRNALHHACKNYNKEFAEKLIIDFKMNINEPDNFGQRPIGFVIKGEGAQNLKAINSPQSFVNLLKQHGARTDF